MVQHYKALKLIAMFRPRYRTIISFPSQCRHIGEYKSYKQHEFYSLQYLYNLFKI